jgi:hypothetical protein
LGQTIDRRARGSSLPTHPAPKTTDCEQCRPWSSRASRGQCASLSRFWSRRTRNAGQLSRRELCFDKGMRLGRYFSSITFVVSSLLGCSGRSTHDAAPAAAGHGGANGSAGAAGATNVHDFTCGVSTSRDDYDSGFEVCDGSDSRTHRNHVASCRSQLPRANIGASQSFDRCTSDEECVDQPNGFCDPGGGPDGVVRICQYGCLVDDDCAAGSICLCGTYIGYCTLAECVTDDDCPTGLLCAAYSTQCHKHVGFACQNPSDTCFDDQDCGPERCERDTDGIRRCTDAQCSGI